MKKLRQIIERIRNDDQSKKLIDYIHKRQSKKDPEKYNYVDSIIPYEKHVPPIPPNHSWSSETTEEDIPIHKIKTTQLEIYPARIKRYIDNYPPTDKLPQAWLHPNGYYYLADGNHRTSIGKLQGDKTIRVKVSRVIKNE